MTCARINILDVEKSDEQKLRDVLASATTFEITIPMPSIGFAGDHLSIAEDFGEALYAGETLAAIDPTLNVRMDYDSQSSKTSLIFFGESKDAESLSRSMCEFAPWFRAANLDESEIEESTEEVRDKIIELEESLPFRLVHFPSLADSYLLNIVNWSSYETLSDASEEEWLEQYPNMPECKYGFIRSSESHHLGGVCFSAPDSWILHKDVSVIRFLQRYGADTDEARALLPCATVHDGSGRIITNDRVAVRPLTSLLNKARRMLVGTAQLNERSSVERFELSRDGSALVAHIDDWKIIDFAAGSRRLDQWQLERTLADVESNTESLRACLGRPTNLNCDWASMTDDSFERLCWDILQESGHYRLGTLMKMGSSRSRDGGRDIVGEREALLTPPKRFIFQCKLITSGRSLSGSKVSVSDVIDQYGAQGFGVLTNTVIDATLHDKLDAIAKRRSIELDVWDSLRIERFLGEHLYIRDRYFPKLRIAPR